MTAATPDESIGTTISSYLRLVGSQCTPILTEVITTYVVGCLRLCRYSADLVASPRQF